MQKRKSVDWLEFVFSRELRGIPLTLVRTDRNINYGTYNEYQAGRYTLFQNKHNGTWFVQWRGKECSTFDPVKEIWRFAEWSGIGLSDITIKRVDVAFDLAIEMPPIDREMVQCRAKVYSFTESNGVTHRFGNSPLFLNIYDKRAERQARRDDMWPHFLETSGLNDGPVTRFEFMCRGRKLKDRGIQTAFDFADRLRELESYLVRDWFWVRKTKNRKGRIPSDLWAVVQGMTQLEYAVTPIEKQGANCKTLKKSGLGSLASAYAGSLSSNDFASEEGFKEFVAQTLKGFVPDEGWHEYLGKRL